MEETSEKKDKVLKCVWCGEEFVWNVGEQMFYESHVDENGEQLRPPKRCKPCRMKKRQDMQGRN